MEFRREQKVVQHGYVCTRSRLGAPRVRLLVCPADSARFACRVNLCRAGRLHVKDLLHALLRGVLLSKLLNYGQFFQSILDFTRRAAQCAWDISRTSLFEAAMLPQNLFLFKNVILKKPPSGTQTYATGTLIEYTMWRATKA